MLFKRLSTSLVRQSQSMWDKLALVHGSRSRWNNDRIAREYARATINSTAAVKF